mmetsp:Transcript_26746/g.30760  ORF Transcript_26746/g.30760 Transcript_26746/m.30760 type:complete len:373 (-) Transcript_26746:125-1243(-)
MLKRFPYMAKHMLCDKLAENWDHHPKTDGRLKWDTVFEFIDENNFEHKVIEDTETEEEYYQYQWSQGDNIFGAIFTEADKLIIECCDGEWTANIPAKEYKRLAKKLQLVYADEYEKAYGSSYWGDDGIPDDAKLSDLDEAPKTKTKGKKRKAVADLSASDGDDDDDEEEDDEDEDDDDDADVDLTIRGRQFVLTGALRSYTRATATVELEARGGTVVKAVSRRCDVAIIGAAAGVKEAVAEACGLELWSEDNLLAALKKGKAGGGKKMKVKVAVSTTRGARGRTVKTVRVLKRAKSDAFEGKKFVITGTLDIGTRSYIKRLIEKEGGFVSDTISRSCDVAIVGKAPGEKKFKAEMYGLALWNEVKLKRELGI